MADTKPSAFTALTGANVAGGDIIPIVDISAALDKGLTAAELLAFLRLNGMPRVKNLTAIHSNSTVTGTKVTDLDMALESGTYQVRYDCICRSATATTGIMLGLNFSTGTAAVKSFTMMWPDASIALTAYTDDMQSEGTKGLGVIAGMPTKTYTTTSPNLGTTVGFKNAAADTPAFILGTIVVTVAGTLELWHSSETTTATTLEVGTCLSVIRTA
jgi:hypothetical protein